MSLDNELLRQDQRTANAFTGSSYEDVLDFYEERGREIDDTAEYRITHLDRQLEGLTQNESGQYFNDAGQRVYVYHESAELGDDRNGYKGQNIVMRTEDEIREAWEADEGMGYFKEANPHMDVDTYMEFIAEKDSMYASGVLELNKQDDLYAVGHKGRGPNADAINAILDEEKARVQAAEAQATGALNNKYGVQTSFQNDDGDLFEFNGSTYTKTHKVDDHMGVGDYVKIGAGVLMSVYAGPMIAGSLGGIMGPAAAKAASAGIMNLANQFMQDGSLSLTDAVMAAGTQYVGGQVWDKVSGGVMDAVGAAEGGDLTKVVDAYEASGKYSAETIKKMRDVADNAYKGVGDAGGVFDKIKDLAGGVDFKDIYDQVTGGDRTDDVIPGETTSEIVNDGTQNEDDEFEEDFGVDVNITGPQFPEVDETEDTSGGGGDVDGGNVDGGGAPGTIGGGDPNAPGGQYEVIRDNGDGTYTVKDNVDGDVWIVKGDYTVGDYVPEADMSTATGAEGELETGTNTDGTEDGSWVNGVWVPSVPTTPAPTPTQPTPTTDATTDGTGGDVTTGTDAGGDVVDGDTSGTSGTVGNVGDVVKDVVTGVVTGVATGGSGAGSGGGNGDGDGDGDGDGNGDGNGDGMMSGSGDYTPQWGDLFAYSTITPYQKKALAPYKDYIMKGRGMLS